MKSKTWLIDAGIGLFLSLVVAGCYVLSLPALESFELKTFDMRSKLRQEVNPSSEIVLIAIDDASIAQIGRWPWPRWRVAAMLDKLSAAGPRVIGLDILFSEPESDWLKELKALESRYGELVAAKQVVEKGVSFAAELSSASVRLDVDARLLASIRAAGNVVLPMYFSLGGVQGAKPEALPPAISSSVVTVQVVPNAEEAGTPDGSKAVYPLVPFAEVSAGVGHVNVYPDFDGVVRREMPVVRYGESYFPSYPVRLLLAYLGQNASDAVFTSGQRLQAGKVGIPLDPGSGMLITFNGPEQTFRYYSYHDVMNDKVSMDVFKDKIVILGPTAAGIGTLYVTPVAPALPAIEMIANVVQNMLHGRFLTRPPWAPNLELGLLGFVGLFIMVGLPRLKALNGAVLSSALLVGFLGLGTWLFIKGDWVKVSYPSILLGLGYIVSTSKRFLVTEKGKELVEASAIETNKMLGLSFQGQGMLDMAYDKFRLCPLDDNMKGILYDLAQDFERKRQFAKAASVLDHIAAKDPGFKDIQEKIKMLKGAAEGAVYGGVGGAKKEGTVMLAGGSTKPTLGRYEIEKELGRGAMGIVYLGKDPKINRMVAIKTMALEEGGDANIKEIKERFFREAESAGTLNHPNIVRIFDAGEENDVAYIAMELLDGHDLVKYTHKESLLPPMKAMEYVAIVADALDYAHAQGIVHRDIKPANVMLLKDGTIRVADFGIARITASSKTATGTVMGTPSYMSPEQVSGKKVDGRSDLFSLSVALFEFMTGEKPFKGGEGIGTLLFQIANDPHPNPLTVNPGLSPGVVPIINRGLAKRPEERYSRGSELAADLRALIAAIKSGTTMPAMAAPVPAPAPAPAPVPEAPLPIPIAAPAPIVSAPVPVAVDFPPPPPPPPEPVELPAAAIPAVPAVEATIPAVPAASPADATVRMTAPAAAPSQDPEATLRMPPPGGAGK